LILKKCDSKVSDNLTKEIADGMQNAEMISIRNFWRKLHAT